MERRDNVLCDALAVAHSAHKLRIPSIIVLSEYTATSKVKELTRLGSTVTLHGASADATREECVRLQSLHDMTLISEPGDECVVAGHGTIGPEIVSQITPSQVKAVFCPFSCGTLIAGLGIYLKRITPNIKLVGVELQDPEEVFRSVHRDERLTLKEYLLSRSICPEVGRICSDVVDDVVQVSMNEVLIATKDIYEDTRQLLEAEGVIAVAGMKSWIISNGLVGSEKDFIAITSEAQLDFLEIPNIIKQASMASMEMGRRSRVDLEVSLDCPGISSAETNDGWSSSTTVVGAEISAGSISDVGPRPWLNGYWV
ncbi:Threonine dehydratase mitochondrial [Fusarium beomiforme]|uniref:Threonine dehydratase mitochondrial n=1 Tax=Fusarium beomiforme TaxID=44412 RepID=A0A9P5AMU3_9HYPO|nr:Threonine dehydratase mitochondrial [Fusarium beomiforme]